MTDARPPRRHLKWTLLAAATLLLLVVLTAGATAADGDNTACLSCHSLAGLTTELPSGEVLPLTVDPGVYNASVHGATGMQCVTCHPSITGFPHPKVTAANRRELQIQQYTQCQGCHSEQYQQSLDSNHARALASGNKNAPVCSDCHGTHDIKKADSPRERLSTTCQRCHSTIFDQYAVSVHGVALLGSKNGDVPVCTDCHGSHTQEDPRTVEFRLNSPNLCGGCHANAALMQKYGISTEVFSTYVADFHGTTVTLFEKQHPDQLTNKAVCTDCHGVHNILPITDANASVVKENLLKTCQRCHPDATPNFPDSWVGHFTPNRDRNPLVYYVNLFYRILIPGVIGAMALFVAVDFLRKIIDGVRRKGA